MGSRDGRGPGVVGVQEWWGLEVVGVRIKV